MRNLLGQTRELTLLQTHYFSIVDKGKEMSQFESQSTFSRSQTFDKVGWSKLK